jgi:hypothetical protein
LPEARAIDVLDDDAEELDSFCEDEEAEEEMGDEKFDGFDSLSWYDFFKDVGLALIDAYDDDKYSSFKEVTDQTTFDLACEELSEGTTKTKIDQLLTECGIQAVGTKRAKVAALILWKSGR